MFDFIVVGAGISGASVAYFLKKSGKKVLVIEKSKIASGGSGAAGAFLSPKICSGSFYTRFVNRAFKFSHSFYKENFSQFLQEDGILRVLKSEDDVKKCKESEKELPRFKFLSENDIGFLKKKVAKNGAYFFNDGSLIDSVGVIKAMLKDIEVIEDLHVKRIEQKDYGYEVEGYKTKGVVFCTGSEVFDEFAYIKLKKIYGHRADIKTSASLPCHIHKECSISSYFKGRVHIGATHIPNYRFKGENEHEKELNQMLQKAKSYVEFEDFELEKVHFGCRSSSFDFFPILGRVVDFKTTLEKFSYIKNGTKVPKKRFVYKENFYIHTGVGARGFVLSPYSAKKLCDLILEDVEINDYIASERLFLKFARESKIK